jgi:hypothetical protein
MTTFRYTGERNAGAGYGSFDQPGDDGPGFSRHVEISSRSLQNLARVRCFALLRP